MAVVVVEATVAMAVAAALLPERRAVAVMTAVVAAAIPEAATAVTAAAAAIAAVVTAIGALVRADEVKEEGVTVSKPILAIALGMQAVAVQLVELVLLLVARPAAAATTAAAVAQEVDARKGCA